jgi:hypothetical protein
MGGNVVYMGLVNDVVPEKLLGRFLGFFRILSVLPGIIFGYFILGKAEAHFTVLLLKSPPFQQTVLPFLRVKTASARKMQSVLFFVLS